MEEKFNGEKIVEGTCKCCGEKDKTGVLENCLTCFVCTVRFVEYSKPCKNCLKWWSETHAKRKTKKTI